MATLARTTFFGREREKERVAELVGRVPLVTLTGVGGAGKTRLAAEVAGGVDGEVSWCELASLRTSDSVAPAVASALSRDDAEGEPAAAVAEALELADAANDTVRAERAREELEAITHALGSAYGLGGRARKAGDQAERARSAVTWRIRSAISRIEAVHPALGRHLKNSVRTGIFCAYTPEQPVDWQL